MSRTDASCILCGVSIGGHNATWLNEFRAIYTEEEDWANPQLSGVGIRTQLTDLAPIDPALHHGDPNLNPSFLRNISLVKSNFGTEILAAPPAEPEPFWGFPFHDSCWRLLSEMYHPSKVDIQLLNNLCRSCPEQWGRLNLGHDFEGLVQCSPDPTELQPGQEWELTSYLNIDHAPRDSFGNLMYSFDPLDMPTLRLDLQQSFAPEDAIDQGVPKDINIAVDPQECFAPIPTEVLQLILLHLPSKNVLSLKLASSVFATTPLPSAFWASRFERGMLWNSASGALEEPEETFMNGCRALWMRTIVIPPKTNGISVSFTEFNNAQYTSDLSGNKLGTDVKVAWLHRRDSSGAIDFNSSTSFDFEGRALKMVSLSISKDDAATGSSVLSLRDTAQWFPAVPDEKLCLNEEYFLDPPREFRKYMPLTTMLYGGPQGIHLSNLVGLTVWIVDYERIYGIDFTYRIEVGGKKTHTLGRRGPFTDAEPRMRGDADSSTDQSIEFQIDGPGGELIDGMEQQEGHQLRGFRIHTNRGRIATFPPRIEDDLPFVPIRVAKSTTITGFYAGLEGSVVLRSLGVISERI
ncbi:MAG: hypothetical protein M1837_001255 [Sclerophora amabilis]|nr:MAG: hypothetical protein M1837_001255 [Sclerophora amabilis]